MHRPLAAAHLKSWMGVLAGAAAWLWFSAVPAAAQCALCYTSAGSAGARGIAALRLGIIILLVPAVVLFLGVLYVALRNKDGAAVDVPPLAEQAGPTFSALEDGPRFIV
jgi:hypothetical protein